MALVLKTLCFVLWMVIMTFLFIGNRYSAKKPYRQLKVTVDKEDGIALGIRKNIFTLAEAERLSFT